MNDTVYFSKCIFTQHLKWDSVFTDIIIDLNQSELSIIVHQYKPSINPTVKIKNGKTNFIPKSLKSSPIEKCLFTYGRKLTEEELSDLKPYCNAIIFQKYNNINTYSNNIFVGYRDEYSMFFQGITNSYIPCIQIPMIEVHNEYPTEKLWKYICTTFLKNEKKSIKNNPYIIWP